MSVTFTVHTDTDTTAIRAAGPVIIDGDAVACNFHNAGARAILGLLKIEGPYLCGELELPDFSRRLTRARATLPRHVDRFVVEPHTGVVGGVTTHFGGLSEDYIKRNLAVLAHVVRQGIDAGATRLTYG